MIFNIPSATKELPENVPKTGGQADGSRQGTNDFQRLGYSGPCPPPGPAHRYSFRLYALSGQIDLPAGATKADLLQAMTGRVLAAAQLTGRYQRRF